MRETPAIQAAVTRRTEKNRPMKIVLAPCRWKNPLRPRQDGLRPAADEARALEEPASAGAPDAVAEVVADDRRGCRDGDDRDDVQLAVGGVDPARD